MFEQQQVHSSLQDSSQYSGRFNNAVVWMVSTRPATSKSSRPFNNPLVTLPKAPIAIGMIVNFIFHSFFNSLAWSWYLKSFLILSVLFCGQPEHLSRQSLLASWCPGFVFWPIFTMLRSGSSQCLLWFSSQFYKTEEALIKAPILFGITTSIMFQMFFFIFLSSWANICLHFCFL